MRISTNTLNSVGAIGLARAQSDLYKAQLAFASGKRINSAADDPSGAVRASELTVQKDTNAQYARNIANAKNTMQFTDSVLSNMSDTIQGARESMLQLGNAGLTASDRKQIATALRGKLSELVNLANTQDESGRYIFAGYRDDTRPVQFVGDSASYTGDNGSKSLDLSSSVSTLTNTSGAELFFDVKGGNGVIETQANQTNTGSGRIDAGMITTPTALTSDSYAINFSVVGGVTTYDVIDSTTGNSLVSGAPYAEGSQIAVGPALSVAVSGTPVNGDGFTVGPSQPRDIFTTIRAVADQVDKWGEGSISDSVLNDSLRVGLANLDRGFDRVEQVRNRFGNQLAEIDRQSDINSLRSNDVAGRLSDIVDLDMAAAATQLSQAQTGYEALGKVVSSVQKQNLFNYI
ncbi:flagellar hook-associated protein FlgL [Derxia gummosa]|uniref:Flagellar hook-associated protein FlgL n=1 Tax=Derxia gummosa DSM 723 TaxID=1121388 RepID=A0A8B6X7L8_9BURK|nr:flagellar hook-associated protein FlgL [Derxia gummosa]